MRRYLSIVLLSLLLASPLFAQGWLPLAKPLTGSCSQSTQFLTRTSGLDPTHITAYDNLICGLVTDGVFSELDVLRIYATQNSTTALLNLVSSSYAGIAHGSPIFTADRGFTGVDASSTVYIDSGFNPSTAGGQYALNSAHLSAWILDNTGATEPAFGSAAGSTVGSYVWPRFTGDGKSYNRINATETGADGATPPAYVGHFVGNRNNSNSQQYYLNGSSFATPAMFSNSLNNLNFYELGVNNHGTPLGSGNQYAMVSIGSSLSSTDAANFYNRLRTYMTAVGVP